MKAAFSAIVPKNYGRNGRAVKPPLSHHLKLAMQSAHQAMDGLFKHLRGCADDLRLLGINSVQDS
jgi:hypothetical protein